METIIKNDNIGLHLNNLLMNGYNYIIKAQDKFLSGWGLSKDKKHIQLIAVKTNEELQNILQGLREDKNEFNYVNWYYINERQQIFNATRGKTYTIRNDWTRYDRKGCLWLLFCLYGLFIGYVIIQKIANNNLFLVDII